MIIGARIIHIENLSSSNTRASMLLKMEAMSEGTVISAGYQSGGRGQAGNKWESEKDKNLLISIILYPSMIVPSEQFIISMAVSLGVCDFLMEHVSAVKIKWPNDIYVRDDKIAGILIENSIAGDKIEHTIAGIGLNINQKEFPPHVPNPVSLSLLTGIDHDLEGCRKHLLAALDNRYIQMLKGSADKIRNEYFSILYRFNEWHDFKTSAGIFNGRIVAVNSFGQLQTEDRNGRISTFSVKEIEFLK
jgi:BirA family biotin operon repressor/biotin-[acetyl-CoA-carboxylase] ligase